MVVQFANRLSQTCLL